MGKRVRMTWPDRVKQPMRPVKQEKHTPFDVLVFGEQISPEELRQRVEFRKAF